MKGCRDIYFLPKDIMLVAYVGTRRNETVIIAVARGGRPSQAKSGQDRLVPPPPKRLAITK